MQPLSLVEKKVPIATFLQRHCRHIVKNKFRRREAISSKSARSFLNIYCFCFSLFVDIFDVINVKKGTPQRKEGVLYTFSSSLSFHIFIVSRKKEESTNTNIIIFVSPWVKFFKTLKI